MPDLTPEQRAAALCRQLWGHRWDDLETEDAIAARLLPVADAIRAADADAFRRGREAGRRECLEAVRGWKEARGREDAADRDAAWAAGEILEHLEALARPEKEQQTP